MSKTQFAESTPALLETVPSKWNLDGKKEKEKSKFLIKNQNIFGLGVLFFMMEGGTKSIVGQCD